MFDLDKAIDSWRRRLTYRRVYLKDDIEELERHLRDHVAWLVDDGVGVEDAFHKAVRSLGDDSKMRGEYAKVFWSKISHRGQLVKRIMWDTVMFKNYLKIAFRNMKRQKGYSGINIVGLTVGLACTFFIVLWVQSEVSIDHFHENGDRIYRVLRNPDNGPGNLSTTDAVTAKLVEVLDEDYPEISSSLLFSWSRSVAFSNGTESFRKLGRNAGPEFFSFFSYPLLAGDRLLALSSPSNIAISYSMAQTFFGDEWDERKDPIEAAQSVLGRVLRVDNREDFTVSAVSTTFLQVHRSDFSSSCRLRSSHLETGG